MRASYLHGLSRAAITVAAASVTLMLACSATVTAVPAPAPDTCNVITPNVPVTPALLASGLPCKAQFVAPFNIVTLQHGFDFYSWLTFLALNSSGDGKTVIGKGHGAAGDAPTIWEGWKDIDSVMRADGSPPTAWGASTPVPAECKGIFEPGMALVSMVGKTPNVLSAISEPFKTGPLIDQNGYYTRYDILMNRTMVDHIVGNQLYNVVGQKKFAGVVDFPAATLPGKPAAGQKTAPGTIGSIMIKLAWKVMGPGDSPERFHTLTALVFTKPVAGTSITIRESCKKATLGLVGMHIAHKFDSDPQWIWSSFEHIDNVPSQAEVNSGHLHAHYNYFDPRCRACKVNEPPPRPWDPNVQPFPGGFKSQITRVIALTDEATQITQSFQAILKGTVWENYTLVSTQWPTDAANKTDLTGKPAPTFLANTTAETYIQGSVPMASSNCIECHNNATTTTGKFSDFTYILENAH
jgi:hypothetical protein